MSKHLLRSEDFNTSIADVAQRWGAIEHAPEAPGEPPRFDLIRPRRGQPFARMRICQGTAQDPRPDWERWNNNQRCELGRNERRNGAHGGNGTFFLYQEGMHTLTEFKMRLCRSWPWTSWDWPGGWQMKQTQPYDSGDPTDTGVALAGSQEGHHFMLDRMWQTPHQHFPDPPVNKWLKVSITVLHSASERGRCTMTFNGTTVEDNGPNLIRNGGEVIPSHLRLGPYANPNCPTLFIDYTNVRIYELA